MKTILLPNLLPTACFCCLTVSISAKADSSATPCSTVLQAPSLTVSCSDVSTQAPLANRPRVISQCDEIVQWEYHDVTYSLNCTSQGMKGYFSPSRWQITQSSGDGGVDVTGAPNALMVEGTGNVQVETSGEGNVQLELVAPAAGYLSFKLEKIGGSNLIPAAIACSRNDQPIAAPREGESYMSPLVNAGDRFSLTFHGTELSHRYQISDFNFYTNAQSVIVRHWTATDATGHHTAVDQFIAIEQASILNIVFPQLSADQTAPTLVQGGRYWPYIDLDGNAATTDDHVSLTDNEWCPYQIEWRDEIVWRQQRPLLVRHWHITDLCGANELRKDQLLGRLAEPKPLPAPRPGSSSPSGSDSELTPKGPPPSPTLITEQFL